MVKHPPKNTPHEKLTIKETPQSESALDSFLGKLPEGDDTYDPEGVGQGDGELTDINGAAQIAGEPPLEKELAAKIIDKEKADAELEAKQALEEEKLKKANAPEGVAPVVHVAPEPGTFKHHVKETLDEEFDEVKSGRKVIPINGAFRKEIWNGDVEVLVFPADMIVEWEKNPTSFDSKLNAKLREQGFQRCQVVDNQVLQKNPHVQGEYVVVKKRDR